MNPISHHDEPTVTIPERVLTRFENRYMPEPNSGCWLWFGFGAESRYPEFLVNGKRWRAHRFSWVIHNGFIPDGMLVCHKCDVKCCVNPEHLFLGTHQDNTNDMMKKGRGKFNGVGTKNSSVKLTEKEVILIREDERSYKKIGADYGVSGTNVGHIKLRKLWAHI